MSEKSPGSHDMFDFAHHAAFVRRNRTIRGLILDYALGLAIVGLNPIPHTLWLTLVVALVLLVKMSWDVGKKWNFPRVYDPLVYLSLLFGGVGSFLFTLIVFLVMLVLSQPFPLLGAFTLSTILFTFAWIWGQTIHHFFANGFPRRIPYRSMKDLPTIHSDE